MVAGFAALIAGSLLTRPEDREQIERFFDSQRRTTDEEPDPVSGLRPLAAERGEDLLLLDLPGWFTAERWQGFFKRYREDLVGFVLAWFTVGLLIALACILQIEIIARLRGPACPPDAYGQETQGAEAASKASAVSGGFHVERRFGEGEDCRSAGSHDIAGRALVGTVSATRWILLPVARPMPPVPRVRRTETQTVRVQPAAAGSVPHTPVTGRAGWRERQERYTTSWDGVRRGTCSRCPWRRH